MPAARAPRAKAAPRQPARRTPNQTVEDIAAKACVDNFIRKGHLTEEEVYSRLINGKCLFATVVADLIRKKTDPNFSMGALYYRQKRDAFRSPLHPLNQLRPAPGNADTIKPELLRAMVANKKNPNDNALFQIYLGAAALPNVSESCGIFRWGLGLSPSSEKQLGACLDLMRFISRHGLQTKQKHLVDQLDSFMDRVICAAKGRAPRVTAAVFCKLHMDICCLVMNRAELQKVIF